MTAKQKREIPFPSPAPAAPAAGDGGAGDACGCSWWAGGGLFTAAARDSAASWRWRFAPRWPAILCTASLTIFSSFCWRARSILSLDLCTSSETTVVFMVSMTSCLTFFKKASCCSLIHCSSLLAARSAAICTCGTSCSFKMCCLARGHSSAGRCGWTGSKRAPAAAKTPRPAKANRAVRQPRRPDAVDADSWSPGAWSRP
mmetsp:Transcript_67726/g.218824  ORF Transcript_67726/g.218824 Transcript_67726/m.218824 type:complete len:201 (-) Transcript_67726:77-679(-)